MQTAPTTHSLRKRHPRKRNCCCYCMGGMLHGRGCSYLLLLTTVRALHLASTDGHAPSLAHPAPRVLQHLPNGMCVAGWQPHAKRRVPPLALEDTPETEEATQANTLSARVPQNRFQERTHTEFAERAIDSAVRGVIGTLRQSSALSASLY